MADYTDTKDPKKGKQISDSFKSQGADINFGKAAEEILNSVGETAGGVMDTVSNWVSSDDKKKKPDEEKK